MTFEKGSDSDEYPNDMDFLKAIHGNVPYNHVLENIWSIWRRTGAVNRTHTAKSSFGGPQAFSDQGIQLVSNVVRFPTPRITVEASVR